MITLFSSYLLNNEILTHREVKKTLRHQVIKDGTLDTIIYELKFLSLEKLIEVLENAYKNDANFFKKDIYEIDFHLIREFGLANVMRYNILPISQNENDIYCFVKSDINEKNIDFIKKEFNMNIYYNVIPEVIFENLKVRLKVSELEDRFQEHFIEELNTYLNFKVIKEDDMEENIEDKNESDNLEQISTSIKSDVEDLVEIKEDIVDKPITIDSFKNLEKNVFFDVVYEEIDDLELLEKKLSHSIEDKELIIDTLLSFLVSKYKLVSFWGKAGANLKLVKYLFMDRKITSKINLELPIDEISYLDEIYVNKKYYLVHRAKINKVLDMFHNELNKFYTISFPENILLFPIFIKERWIGLFIIDNNNIDFTVDDFASFEIVSNFSKKYLEEYILYKKQSSTINNPISEVIMNKSLKEQDVALKTEIPESTPEEDTTEGSIDIEIPESTPEEDTTENSIDIETPESTPEEDTTENSIDIENISKEEVLLSKLNDQPSIDEEYEEKKPEVFNKSSYYFKTKEEYIKAKNGENVEILEKKKVDLPVLDLSEVNIIETPEPQTEKLELEMSNIIIEKDDDEISNKSIETEETFLGEASRTNIEINLTEEEVEVKNEHITINSELITPINMRVEDFVDKLNNAKRTSINDIISENKNLNSLEVMDKILEIFPGRLWMNEIDAYNFIVPIEQHGPILYYLVKNKDINLSKLKEFFNSMDNQKKFYSIYIYTKIKDEDVIPSLINKITDRVVSLVAIKALENHKKFKIYTRIKYKFESAVHSKMPSIVIDWITAIKILRDEFFVPILIDALDTWKKEKIIKNKIVELLTELTKQDFGDSEKKWSKWWANNQYKMRKDWILDGLIHKKKKIRISSLNEAKKCFKSLYNYTVDLSTKEQLKIIDKIKEDEYDKRRGVL